MLVILASLFREVVETSQWVITADPAKLLAPNLRGTDRISRPDTWTSEKNDTIQYRDSAYRFNRYSTSLVHPLADSFERGGDLEAIHDVTHRAYPHCH